MQNDPEILAATLSPGLGLKATYRLKKKDGTNTSLDENCPAPIHNDLRKAFKRLNVHLAVISEIIPHDEIKNIEKPKHGLLDSFSCTSFELLDKQTGVKLVGERKLSTGKHLGLKTPPTKWNDKKHKYAFLSDLTDALEEIKAEIIQYLFHGKKAPDVQQTLPGMEVDQDGNFTQDFIDEIGEE